MNALQLLAQKIKDQIPDVGVAFDEPHHPHGNHWLDLRYKGKHIPVEWKPGVGFGFFANDASYGERPELVKEDEASALDEALKRLSG